MWGPLSVPAGQLSSTKRRTAGCGQRTAFVALNPFQQLVIEYFVSCQTGTVSRVNGVQVVSTLANEMKCDTGL